MKNKNPKSKGKKDRLKPISFHGHKAEDVIRAIMKVDPEKLKKKAEKGKE